MNQSDHRQHNLRRGQLYPKRPIIPAILTTSSSDFSSRLAFAQGVCDAVHLDLIDSHHIAGSSLPIDNWPQLTIGYAEVHLMVDEPLKYLEALRGRKVTRAIVHVESLFDLDELASRARELDLMLGFAVDLDTDLEQLKRFFVVSNYIQIMGVVPGRSGQSQHPQTTLALAYLSKVPQQRLLLTVDGGVSSNNIQSLKEAGADYLVAASAIFGSGDWQENYHQLLSHFQASQPTSKV